MPLAIATTGASWMTAFADMTSGGESSWQRMAGARSPPRVLRLGVREIRAAGLWFVRDVPEADIEKPSHASVGRGGGDDPL